MNLLEEFNELIELTPHKEVCIGGYWIAGIQEINANHVRQSFEIHIHPDFPPNKNPGLKVAVYSKKGDHVLPIQIGNMIFSAKVKDYCNKFYVDQNLKGWFVEIPNPVASGASNI